MTTISPTASPIPISTQFPKFTEGLKWAAEFTTEAIAHLKTASDLHGKGTDTVGRPLSYMAAMSALSSLETAENQLAKGTRIRSRGDGLIHVLLSGGDMPTWNPKHLLLIPTGAYSSARKAVRLIDEAATPLSQLDPLAPSDPRVYSNATQQAQAALDAIFAAAERTP